MYFLSHPLEPSPSEMYLVAVLLYGVMLLGELLSIFFPKQLLFLRGFRFLQEIAEYERKRIGKQQTRNERIGNAGILIRIHKVDKAKPGQFRWFTLKSLALGVILGVVAVALLNAGFGGALN